MFVDKMHTSKILNTDHTDVENMQGVINGSFTSPEQLCDGKAEDNSRADTNSDVSVSKSKDDKIKTHRGHLHDLPPYMHDNEYIKTGYRINHNTFGEVFCTVFKCHNETVNVWSHGLGTFMFLIIAIVVICVFPNMEREGQIGEQYLQNL